ncbi:MAG: HDOD domain-containing protein [Vicinamibacterales bacterium]|nr:HDOD domain-containing protein [Vicinamibacterales bacterium]
MPAPAPETGDGTDALRALLAAPDAGIPMLPALAQRVIAAVAGGNTPVWQIASLASKDQVLAARLLGLANSAYCAPLHPISTVQEAIVRMGTAAVRNLVVTVCVASRLHDPLVYGRQGRSIVEHGLGAAYLARLVAERAGVNADEAFLCGLLHDLGKLVILKRVHDLARTGRPVPDHAALEALIAELHAAVGADALARWELPEEICEAVRWHHTPDTAPRFQRRAMVTALASRLAHRYGFGCTASDAPFLDDPSAQALGLDEAWLAGTDQHAPGLFDVARQLLN